MFGIVRPAPLWSRLSAASTPLSILQLCQVASRSRQCSFARRSLQIPTSSTICRPFATSTPVFAKLAKPAKPSKPAKPQKFRPLPSVPAKPKPKSPQSQTSSNQPQSTQEDERLLTTIPLTTENTTGEEAGQEGGGKITGKKDDGLATEGQFEGVYSEWNNAPKWMHKYVVKAMVSSQEEPPILTNTQRLLKPALLTAAIIAGCVTLAYNFSLPRLFPGLPIAVETIAPIILVNIGVFLLWRMFPPAWFWLNKYALSVPAMPTSLSMIGCMFSHQRPWHLSVNMVVLYLLGSTLADQIGPSNFLALYFSTGVFASFMSLAFNVALKRWEVMGLGASGAVYGVIGAYGWLNPDREVFFILFPLFKFKASTILAALGTYELTALVMAWSIAMDHMAHLSGMALGVVLMDWLKKEVQRREDAMREEIEASLLLLEEEKIAGVIAVKDEDGKAR